MPEEFSVKGATIASKFEFIEEKFGKLSLDRFQEKLLEGKAPKIFTAGWYPFSLYNHILEQMVKKFFYGDVSKLEQVGAYSARTSLQSVYRIFIREKGFISFLSRIASLHSMFYSHGKLHVEVGKDGKSCSIKTIGQPVVTETDAYVASGFYKEAANQHRVKNIKCNFYIKDGVISFQLTWS